MSGSRRRGLVLGAGGVLGAAWMTGALCALEEVEGYDVRKADLLVGTSAGSVLVAMLAGGLPAAALYDHQLGVPLPGGLEVDWDHDRSTGGPLPPRPPLRIGSRELLRRASRREVGPRAGFWALMPPGRRNLDALAAVVDRVVGAGRWAGRDGVRIVAVDYRTGDRVSFGAPGAPQVPLSRAVAASCAIPGWYAPVLIEGRPYVDGGTRSAASVDLIAEERLDEVVVLAPLASFALDRPASVVTRFERRWRRYVTSRLLREAEVVRQSGTRVTILAPGPEDLAEMGPNMMDPARRLRVLETARRTAAEALAGVAVPSPAVRL